MTRNGIVTVERLGSDMRNGKCDNNATSDMESKKAEVAVSEMRKTMSQFCAIGASSALTLSFGISIGISTILIPELYKENAEIVVTKEELTWISSIGFLCIPLGAITSGPISQRIGRRTSLALAAGPFIIAWLLMYFSGPRVWPIFLAFILLGVTGGFVEAPIQVYVTEISEPRLRGSISSSVSAMITFGIFVEVVIGTYLYWRTLTLVNIGFTILAFLAMCSVPESPYWLAGKGKLDKAQRSLSWLRGWTTPENVAEEFKSIIEACRPKKQSPSKYSCESISQRYFRRTVYLPFILVSFCFFVSCFNGQIAALTYAVLIFEKLESPIDEHEATIVLLGLQVLASFSMMVIVPYAGKRKLVFMSLIFSGLAMMVVTSYTFARDLQIIPAGSVIRWIPSIFLVIAILATTMGIKNIPWILAGEVFPNDVRGEATGVVGSTCNIYAAIASKTFLYMLDFMTLPGTFLFFVVINFVGLVILYRALPETEGRTLAEIEKYFEDCKIRLLPKSWKVRGNKKKYAFENHGLELS